MEQRKTPSYALPYLAQRVLFVSSYTLHVPITLTTEKYYDGFAPGSVLASTNTSYKWSFTSKLGGRPGEDDALRATRMEVGKDTWGRDADWTKRAREEGGDGAGVGNGSRSGKVHGPLLPTAADMTLARELVDAQRAEERVYKHAKNKKETRDMIEDLVGPKPVGRESMLEKKALKRDGDRAFREKGDEGLEVDEGTLMGGGDSFQAMWVSGFWWTVMWADFLYFLSRVARRERGKRKYEQKHEERITAIRERSTAMKEKERVRDRIVLLKHFFRLTLKL